MASASNPRVPAHGLLLGKLHRTAFESNLIGIDPDYRVRASQRLLAEADDPLTAALRELDGAPLRLPNYPEHRPDRDLLAARYHDFLHAD